MSTQSPPTTTKPGKKVRRVPPRVEKSGDERIKLMRKATSRINTKASIDFVKSVRGR